ncbi:MAG: putative manganese transporter [Bacteroidales bacterium]
MITAFVLFMMVVIEYINVQSKNIWSDKLQKSPYLQIIIAAFLGIVPGCMGAFTVVSLYAHRMMGLAGLVTVMIATSGDEAFVMFALFPGKALLLHALLFIIAVIIGMVVNYFTSHKKKTVIPFGFIIHEKDYCKCFVRQKILPQLRNILFERAALLIVTSLFIFFLINGQIGPAAWNWKKITFLAGNTFLLFVFLTVPDHFLKEHLYQHIIRKHLLRIFLWTLGAFIALHFIQSSLVLNNIMENNRYLIMLIAILLGIIPESGPHLIFVTLFSQNQLPFSILFANSIVQDGHGMLPLLAESRKDFIKVKAINLVVGLIVGYTLLMIGL